MLDRTAPHRRWRALGRLLPTDVRERIFEPAFSDLTVAWLRSEQSRRVPFGVRAMGTYVGCFSLALPRLLVHNGRLTRLGRCTLWAAGLIATTALVVANAARSYTSYTP